ncbi:hypothetical protein INT47_012601 [Mucor saturninus]|uniref:non-specific serine/threonine protein kinase n=1 Tax=Mucor saturninus TaxID=64648 RepID=A0A8H7R4Z4_9FUNG|nr:hypothetical protein INT47_012601 [Mucor saturninus]
MESNSNNKRRASETKATEALALVSKVQRIPPPLPYLPSDYRPSPDGPRHFLISSSNPMFEHTTNRRQRSHSISHTLAIESSQQQQQQQHFELVPYREWTVIARNNEKGQLVLYNQDNQTVTVQNYSPDEDHPTLNPSKPVHVMNKELGDCPYCHRPLETKPAKSKEFDYMDRNYFRLLASSQTDTAQNSPAQSRSNTFSATTSEKPLPDQNLNANAFNQGYYDKFFVEESKLGKGFRGSVFLCEHMLDGVKLGKYAIKKVAIGNNHPWLVRMLREVHLLERLRHPNIVSYKHSWLEYNRLTPFGPEVPCLFILMECANGGNLEEYFENHIKPTKKSPAGSTAAAASATAATTTAKSAKELKRERIKRQLEEQASFEQEKDLSAPEVHLEKRLLTMTEIWSLFLDIVQGLAHLHQQNIVHRDLKPPNLLLQYDERNRNGHHGIPRVLISDFGECEDLDATSADDENRTGATGTLEFMAPEHVRLDPRGRNTVDYSPKADMWSLGMVLYYLCYSRLPYSVIADVDVLRDEILSFKDVRFPVSRYDIYKDHRELLEAALHDPTIQADIPNELKLLIRMLLSIDPNKRPSCNEILSKLRRIRREDNTTVFQDMPNDWTCDPVVVQQDEEEEEGKVRQKSRSVSPMKRTKVKTKPVMVETVGLRKRQRLLQDATVVEEETSDSVMEEPRLLLESPQTPSVSSSFPFTDRQAMKGIKTVTGVLKIASCTWCCSPYSTRPSTLYPVIFFALMDFWNEANSPSLLLIVLHVIWITGTTLVSGGLCDA